jgi:hypothetical protein
VYGYYAGITLRDAVIKHIIIECQREGFYEEEVIGDTVGQFTGLTDSNGKEVYEGDIIEIWADEPENLTVQFHESGQFVLGNNGRFPYNMKGVSDKGIVVGNIHDNKYEEVKK